MSEKRPYGRVKVYVYGHKEYVHDEACFSNKDEVVDYLSETLFRDEDCRYRYVQNKNADIIVFSWKGDAYGHMDIEDRVQPTIQDKEDFPPVKKVYIIHSTSVYEKPVNLSELDIKNIQFGREISDKFEEIKSRAGNIKNYYSAVRVKENSGKLEKGDIIVIYNDIEINRTQKLKDQNTEQMKKNNTSGTVNIVVFRNKKIIELEMKVGKIDNVETIVIPKEKYDLIHASVSL